MEACDGCFCRFPSPFYSDDCLMHGCDGCLCTNAPYHRGPYRRLISRLPPKGSVGSLGSVFPSFAQVSLFAPRKDVLAQRKSATWPNHPFAERKATLAEPSFRGAKGDPGRTILSRSERRRLRKRVRSKRRCDDRFLSRERWERCFRVLRKTRKLTHKRVRSKRRCDDRLLQGDDRGMGGMFPSFAQTHSPGIGPLEPHRRLACEDST